MARFSCTELGAAEQEQLLGIARQSLHSGLDHDLPVSPDVDNLTDSLNSLAGVFVTLSQQGKLRGCVGAMEATQPLVRMVAESAYSAAFRDPRFAQLEAHELDITTIEISVLSTMEPLPAASRGELLATLRPGRDGLLLQDRHYRSTFLPKVWEQLPDPRVFLDHLLTKAGLPIDHWSATLTFFRYETVSFSETSTAEKPCIPTSGE